jgi:hypothetical protein
MYVHHKRHDPFGRLIPDALEGSGDQRSSSDSPLAHRVKLRAISTGAPVPFLRRWHDSRDWLAVSRLAVQVPKSWIPERNGGGNEGPVTVLPSGGSSPPGLTQSRPSWRWRDQTANRHTPPRLHGGHPRGTGHCRLGGKTNRARLAKLQRRVWHPEAQGTSQLAPCHRHRRCAGSRGCRRGPSPGAVDGVCASGAPARPFDALSPSPLAGSARSLVPGPSTSRSHPSPLPPLDRHTAAQYERGTSCARPRDCPRHPSPPPSACCFCLSFTMLALAPMQRRCSPSGQSGENGIVHPHFQRQSRSAVPILVHETQFMGLIRPHGHSAISCATPASILPRHCTAS